MTNQTYLYKSGPISITSTMLRFRHRRYAIRNIENTVLQRPLFIMGAGLGAMCLGFLWFNTDILYSTEMLFLFVVAIVLPAITWPWATLYIQSKLLSTNEGTITWKHSVLVRVQDVIENMPDVKSKTGGVVFEEPAEESDDYSDE